MRKLCPCGKRPVVHRITWLSPHTGNLNEWDKCEICTIKAVSILERRGIELETRELEPGEAEVENEWSRRSR
jgi:hypothetical protein